MKFQAHAKNLRLLQKAGYQDVDKSAGFPIVVNYPQTEHQFRYGLFETEDQDLITWLKKHRMFSEVPNVPGMFWEYVPPRDLEAELKAAEAEKAALQAELEALKANKPEPKKAPSAKDIAKEIAKEEEQKSASETPKVTV